MNRDKVNLRLAQFGTALNQLKEAIGKPDSTYGKTDILIQRFEFCYELGWKTLRQALEIYGHETGSPRQAFQKAFVMNLIDDEKTWITMLEDRNLTSHTYKEETANKIAASIPAYATEMLRLHARLTTLLDGA